jgi:hypothetical protein
VLVHVDHIDPVAVADVFVYLDFSSMLIMRMALLFVGIIAFLRLLGNIFGEARLGVRHGSSKSSRIFLELLERVHLLCITWKLLNEFIDSTLCIHFLTI